MNHIADIAIPVVTFFVMGVVGLELKLEDFARVARPPTKLMVATATQTLLLPLIAFAVIAVLDPPLHRTLGLIVIAGCPGGAFSNFFTALARGETALSVALTTTCTLVSVVTLPVVTAIGFSLYVTTAEAVQPPVLLMSGQLVALLVVPLLAGMALSRWRESFFSRVRARGSSASASPRSSGSSSGSSPSAPRKSRRSWFLASPSPVSSWCQR